MSNRPRAAASSRPDTYEENAHTGEPTDLPVQESVTAERGGSLRDLLGRKKKESNSTRQRQSLTIDAMCSSVSIDSISTASKESASRRQREGLAIDATCSCASTDIVSSTTSDSDTSELILPNNEAGYPHDLVVGAYVYRGLVVVELFFLVIQLSLLRCLGLIKAAGNFFLRPWQIITVFRKALLLLALLIFWVILLLPLYSWALAKSLPHLITRKWGLIKRVLPALLLNYLPVFRSALMPPLKPTYRSIGIQVIVLLITWLACSTSLAPLGMTVCHPVARNSICGIPYAHHLVPYCDPPRGPRPIANGSDYFFIPTAYNQIINASEEVFNLPDLFKTQIRLSENFASRIYLSNLTCKDEVMELVNIFNHETSLSLKNITAHGWKTSIGVKYSTKRLSAALQEHSVPPEHYHVRNLIYRFLTGHSLPLEPSIHDYKDAWITFFQETTNQLEELTQLATATLHRLDRMKGLLTTISTLVTEEQLPLKASKDKPPARTHNNNLKLLQSIEDSCATSFDIVTALIDRLGEAKSEADVVLRRLQSPDLPKRASLTVAEQVVVVDEVAKSLELALSLRVGDERL